MAPRKNTTRETPPNPNLLILRADVATKLNELLDRGMAIRSSEIRTGEELDRCKDDRRRWMHYTKEYLKRVHD